MFAGTLPQPNKIREFRLRDCLIRGDYWVGIGGYVMEFRLNGDSDIKKINNTNMALEFSINGVSGSDAVVALNVAPVGATTILVGEKPNVQIFTSSTKFQKVGTYPCEVKFQIRFLLRPWKFDLELPNGTLISRENTKDSILVEPDRVTFIVKFTI